MPKMTAGYAKNTIRRALRAVVDPEPSEKEVAEIWEFFSCACAYCGRRLKQRAREAHVDHLVPATAAGTNHISNRVLSCSRCNGDEKGDKPWLDFLCDKTKDQTLLKNRRKRIEDWIARNTPSQPAVISSELLTRETERAVAAFDEAVARLRRAENASHPCR